jgi:hypothetical protein
MPAIPLSQTFRELDAQAGDKFSLGAITAAAGSRMHGLALLVLALPDAIPVPVPSLSAVLGIPLVIVSAHLAIYGEESSLPERAQKVEIPHGVIHFLAHRVSPILAAIEKLCRPRLAGVVARQRVLGLVSLYLSLILLLPIPLLNTPPALCIVAIALGLVQRDGLAALIGVIGTAALTVMLFLLTDWLYALAASFHF